jgi:hypothetical protein
MAMYNINRLQLVNLIGRERQAVVHLDFRFIWANDF